MKTLVKTTAFNFLSLIICIPVAIAQKIGLDMQASANYPLIPTYTQSIYPYKWVPVENTSGVITVNNSTKIQEKFRNNLGGKLGLNVSFSLKNNFILRTGIGFNVISFKREFQYIDLAVPETSGFGTYTIPYPSIHSTDLGKTFLLYTDIPVSAGYKFLKEKLIVTIGFTVSILTLSYQCVVDPYHKLNNQFDEMIKDNTGMGLEKISLLVNAEVSYQLKKKISIFTRFSIQFTPIYQKDFQYVGDPKYSLLELGAGYRIF